MNSRLSEIGGWGNKGNGIIIQTIKNKNGPEMVNDDQLLNDNFSENKWGNAKFYNFKEGQI